MRVLILGESGRALGPLLPRFDRYFESGKLDFKSVRKVAPDLIVSFGYRHILSPQIFHSPIFRALNVHISLLPWNKGSDPNFWSWLENTPKGVSVHRMVEKVDSGDIVHQEEVSLSPNSTLRKTYNTLISQAVAIFPLALEKHLSNEQIFPQTHQGTFHQSSDFDNYRFLLNDKGWDTSCLAIQEYGGRHGLWRLGQY